MGQQGAETVGDKIELTINVLGYLREGLAGRMSFYESVQREVRV